MTPKIIAVLLKRKYANTQILSDNTGIPYHRIAASVNSLKKNGKWGLVNAGKGYTLRPTTSDLIDDIKRRKTNVMGTIANAENIIHKLNSVAPKVIAEMKKDVQLQIEVSTVKRLEIEEK